MPILRPSQPITEQVADLYLAGNLLCLKFRESREDFKILARGLHLYWNQAEWRRERKITAQTGAAEDRLVEAAYKLLGAGFIVSVPDDIDPERVIAGDYTDEHTRWVRARTSGKYAGWFALNWAYGEEYYHKARKLPGSRYSKPCVVVPAEYFEEVADFAALYDFRLSDGAERLLAEAQAKRLQMVRVELRPRAIAATVTVAAPTVISGIADEFRDEDCDETPTAS